MPITMLGALLVVGFYLINIGFVTLTLRFGVKPENLREAIEFLSTKVGFVLVVLGGMHFLNMYIFARMRRTAIDASAVPSYASVLTPAVPPIQSQT